MIKPVKNKKKRRKMKTNKIHNNFRKIKTPLINQLNLLSLFLLNLMLKEN